jgi:hypothetical protein
MKYLSHLWIALALLCSLSACAQVAATDANVPVTQRPASLHVRNSSEPTTYVTNTNGTKGSPSISIYANGGSTFSRSISPGYSFALDTKGHLFVSEQRQNAGYPLNIYDDQGAKLVQTIYQGHSFNDMQLDANGNLFNICALKRVCEYPTGKGGNVLQPHISRELQFNPQKYSPIGMLALDPRGDLAVLAAPTIAIFHPKQHSPYWSIPIDSYLVSAIEFDNSGDLYVAVENPSTAILEFAPGETSPSRTIADSAGGNVASLAVDQLNNLYALTVGPAAAAVSVYPQGSNQPSLVISSGLIANEASSLAVSPSGEVFVGNQGNPGNVVVYASGKTHPMRTVTDQIDVPDQIGLGP